MGNEIEPEDPGGLTPAGSAGAIPSPADPSAGDLDMDQLSAAIRADASDTDSFFSVLATKLQDALGDKVQIKREGGLFKREQARGRHHHRPLDRSRGGVRGDPQRQAAIECTVNRPVRGIVVSSKPVHACPSGSTASLGHSQTEARQSEQTWTALHGHARMTPNSSRHKDPKSRPPRKATR